MRNYESIRTKEKDPKLTFRLPIDFKNRLKISAERAGRTLNAEIMVRLVTSLKECEFITEVPIKKMIREKNDDA